MERPNSVGGREHVGDVVVAPSDTNVFHNIARVEDVSSGGRDFNLYDFLIAVLDNLLYLNSHLGGTGLNLLSVELESKNSVDVVNLNVKVVVSHGGSDFLRHVGSVFVNNLNLFAFVLPFTSAVGGELGGHDSETDLSFLEIHSGDLNEDILGGASYLSCVRVDKRRERKDLSVGVVENGEFIVAIEDRQELLHYIIGLVKFTKLISGHALGLLESLEFNVSRGDSLVSDGTLNLVQIMSSHRS